MYVVRQGFTFASDTLSTLTNDELDLPRDYMLTLRLWSMLTIGH